jgi:hypothetical protein
MADEVIPQATHEELAAIVADIITMLQVLPKNQALIVVKSLNIYAETFFKGVPNAT